MAGDSVAQEVRDYYGTVSRFIDRERPDEPSDALWRRLAGEERGGAALDLGCGTGRVTALLASRMEPVIGVDLSLAMLARARARAGEREEGGRLHLIAADLRDLALGRRFALVVAANDPLAHLSEGRDRDRALATVARHLDDRGRFVLDAHWFPPDRLRRARDEGLVEEHAGEGLTVRETWHCRSDGACQARYEYLRDGERVDEARFESRYWSVEEVRSRFARAGLAVTSLWGDYEGRPWHPESSRHLIVEARIAHGGPAAG